MKRYGYLVGSIEMVLGILLLCLASIIKEVLPAVGRLIYQFVQDGSFVVSDYSVSFPLVIIFGVILIVAGIAQIIYTALKKREDDE